MKKYIIGNWKMNMLRKDAEQFIRELVELQKTEIPTNTTVCICAPFTLLGTLENILPSEIELGAQNCHWLESGAQTGEISPSMLKDFGVTKVILGHSERRQFYGETNQGVSKRAQAAIKAGITPIICIGESKTEYEAKRTNEVILAQLQGSLEEIASTEIIIAYEPVWAIGTGLSADRNYAAGVHKVIREYLIEKFGPTGEIIPIIYGGSTNPANIASYFEEDEISGALIGGASLKAESFLKMVF
jgi:triosephosphate isomerase (TIM)